WAAPWRDEQASPRGRLSRGERVEDRSVEGLAPSRIESDAADGNLSQIACSARVQGGPILRQFFIFDGGHKVDLVRVRVVFPLLVEGTVKQVGLASVSSDEDQGNVIKAHVPDRRHFA